MPSDLKIKATDPQIRLSVNGSGGPLGLRLAVDLRDRVKAAAKANNRSMNAEIVARLEASFDAGSASLGGEMAALIERHVDQQVQARLRQIAASIGGSN